MKKPATPPKPTDDHSQPAAFLFWKTQSRLARLALRLQHLLHLKRLNRKER
ncbi:hypothetical protein [Thiomicrorhabdus cannonii]|uniref:hypothetical protein n=1 Tax=Thiomicrorhabdus cannonii TaxID=2748011 RepID=UPI0015BAD5CA|nr:hypothetical protein [Thiomicrorhabdus cannonii]